MTPKERAVYLVQSFIDEGFLPAAARIAALVTVEEIIKSYRAIYDDCIRNIDEYKGARYGMRDYWEAVEKELEAL